MIKILLTLYCSLLMLTSFSQNPMFQWAKNFGGINYEEGNGIVTDASGNVYTTGLFQGTVDFDPGPGTYTLSSTGSDDIFVSKLDASGNFVWAVKMGGSQFDRGYSIDIDSSGNILTTGSFEGTCDFDPGAGTYTLSAIAVSDFFVSKLDSSGNFIWAKSMGGSSIDLGSSVKVSPLGDVYITGRFQNTVDFDPDAGTYSLTSAGYFDAFLLKLDSSGNFISAINIGSTNMDAAEDVHVDALGNVYVVGNFKGTVDFDPGAPVFNLTSTNNGGVFVFKLDAAGNFQMATMITGSSTATGNTIITDANGNIIIGGIFNGTMDFDPGAGVSNLTSAGAGDAFILKLTSSGNYIFAGRMGGTGNDNAIAISTDNLGCIYSTGYFNGTADFDPGTGNYTLNSSGQSAFISKLSSSGTFIWALKLASNNALGKGITVDATGFVSTTGMFIGSCDFDPVGGSYILNAAGSGDVFVYSLLSSLTTNIADQKIDDRTLLYPNPTNGHFILNINDNLSSEFMLFNILGEKVFSQRITDGINHINASVLPKGIYFYSLFDTNRELQKGKIIIN